ncbi:protein amalgam-like isoform X2 [Macrobrachium nipponense]|uniref:protein amalgam-like isoform X2 n=1 Tax=Macrobrachium nipponense TaxID=159736 RepID=UPI0030C88F56
MWSFVILLEAIVATALASEVETHDVEENLPNFTATPQDFTVEVDGEITFPCDVENLGTDALMFRHIGSDGETKLIFVAERILREKDKFTKIGNSFVLSGVKRRHAGKYECRIEMETGPVIQVMHTLNVQYPASVKRISPVVQNVAKGSSVTLECAADGNPKAAINWSKRKGHLPSGAQSEEGFSLTLENVDRHVEGTYICTASNGVGPPSSTSMSIEVEYPPEIVTEETMLHTGEGNKANLICIVHGRPSPTVTWMKDGKRMTTDDFLQDRDGFHKHTLTIEKVEESHFGEYTCIAQNRHGEIQQTLMLTGLPKPPRVTSSPAGGERTAYTITWETESNSPITQYRLKYRKAEGPMNFHVHGGWDDRLYPPRTLEGADYMGPIHHMSHPLNELEPATDYEAIVSVENKFGWSNGSEIFHFYTRKDPTTTTTTTTTTTLAPEPENIAPLLEEVAVGQSASGVYRQVLCDSLLIVMLTVLCAFAY